MTLRLPLTADPDELSRLINAFDRAFRSRLNTCLVGGFEEPVYLPSLEGAPAEIRFTRNYIRSALHEVAHWCIAGSARLQKADYGYWYRPDGRTAEEQREFFRFEGETASARSPFFGAMRSGVSGQRR